MSHNAEVRERLYWLSDPSWYTFEEGKGYVLTDKATDEAKNSYRKWEAHQKE